MSNLLKFCPKCGRKHLVSKKKSNRYTCRYCSFLFYFNPAPCVGAIILKDKKVLLGRRKNEPYKGYWDVPGGFMEAKETPEEALKREMKEELSVDIIIDDLIGFFPDTYGEKGVPTINIFYFAKIKKGRLKAATDMAELKWFDLKKLPKKIAFQNSKDVLRLIQSMV